MSISSEDLFTGYKVRPRFKIETSYSADIIIEKIRAGLKKENAPCRGEVNPSYATIYLPLEDQHYWSPQLSVSLEKTEKGCILRGLYGPRPVVWTMFVFFYSLIAVAILFITVIGFSYFTLDKSAEILWAVPILILVFLTLYLVAHFGQKLGQNQMVTLHKFIEKSTGLAI